MHFDGQYYYVTIPAYPYQTHIFLQLKAWDGQGNMGITPLGEYTVQSSDHEGPSITDVSYLPITPYTNESILVSAIITDSNSIAIVILSYHDGAIWRNLTMQTLDGNQYTVILPAIGSSTTVIMKIHAQDAIGNWAISPTQEITILELPQPPPPQPELIALILVGAASATIAAISVGAISYVIQRKKR
jgi:hypothetical protein